MFEAQRLKSLLQQLPEEQWMVMNETFEPCVYVRLNDGCRGKAVCRMNGLYSEDARQKAKFIVLSREALPEIFKQLEQAERLIEQAEVVQRAFCAVQHQEESSDLKANMKALELLIKEWRQSYELK